MKYINYFSNINIPYCIYKLNKGDCIININKQQQHQTFIILYGIICMIKIFNYNENLCMAILNKDNIINLDYKQNYSQNNYSKIIAIKTTYIVSFNIKHLYQSSNAELFKQILKSYSDTLKNYGQMNYILGHKYIKDRLMQLLLFLCIKFGLIKNKIITLNIPISKHNLAMIIGCNINTINLTLKSLKPYMKLNINKQTIYFSNIL